MENKQVVLEVKNLSFKYPTASKLTLNNINFTINKGEFVVMCGSSGSGKTTLAKCLNGIFPHLSDGEISGDIIFDGKSNVENCKMHEISSKIGMVFQNPEDQIFSIRVADEVALGVEMQGYKKDEIVKRVDYALKKLRINDIKNNLTFALSGGQKQKISIASNIAMLPEILILDDPTTDLDPISKQEVMDILRELKKEVDVTFIVIEHDLNDLFNSRVDRLIVMHEGQIIANGKPEDVIYNNYKKLDEIGIRIPDHIRLAKYLYEKGYSIENSEFPVKKDEVFEWTKSLLVDKKLSFPNIKYTNYENHNNEIIAKIEHVNFTYKGVKKPTLFDINFEVKKGEFLAIVGHNGSGKSTLMKNVLGLLHPTDGDIIINGRNTKNTKIEDLILDIGYVFQNPDNQLFCNTVREEIQFGLHNRNFPEDVIEKQTQKTLEIVGLEDEAETHPFSLSRGQRQRLAVATMIVSDPKIIMLDEPTTGQDEQNLKGLLELMHELIDNFGATIIMVTHDMEIVAKHATRVIVISGGKIALEGTPNDIFYKHYKELQELKLKPPIISSMSAALSDYGMPYIPSWDVFNEQVRDRNYE